jgi:hypothetical protein
VADVGYGRQVPRRSHHSLRREAANDRRGAGRREDRTDDGNTVPLGGRQTQYTPQGDYLIRKVPGEATRKVYRCPGCQQLIPVGTPHVVVWPADDLSWAETAVDSRRHWHTSCWQRASTRSGPGAVRR